MKKLVIAMLVSLSWSAGPHGQAPTPNGCRGKHVVFMRQLVLCVPTQDISHPGGRWQDDSRRSFVALQDGGQVPERPWIVTVPEDSPFINGSAGYSPFLFATVTNDPALLAAIAKLRTVPNTTPRIEPWRGPSKAGARLPLPAGLIPPPLKNWLVAAVPDADVESEELLQRESFQQHFLVPIKGGYPEAFSVDYVPFDNEVYVVGMSYMPRWEHLVPLMAMAKDRSYLMGSEARPSTPANKPSLPSPPTSRLRFYKDDTFEACLPADWTAARQDNPYMKVLGMYKDDTLGANAVVVPSVRQLPFGENWRLAGFELAANVARDFLRLEGTLREGPKTAVFAGAEGTWAFYSNATLRDFRSAGPLGLVDVYARLQGGSAAYFGYAYVKNASAANVTTAKAVVESVRFPDVPQLAVHRRSEADCSSGPDTRIVGTWWSSRSSNSGMQYRFDGSNYFENLGRKGVYTAAGGNLTIDYDAGHTVSCQYTINGDRLILRACNRDFPTDLIRVR